MTTLAAYWYYEDQNEPSMLMFLTLPGVDFAAELTQFFLKNLTEDEDAYDEGCTPTADDVTVEKDNHYAEYALNDGDGGWLFASTVGYVSPLPV